MYQPPHFREEDLATQQALIRAHPLGLLVTSGNGGLIANAVPFHLDAEARKKARCACISPVRTSSGRISATAPPS